MPSAFLPTDADRRLLQGLLDAYRRGLLNVPQRPHAEEAQPQAPEVYVALTPAGGIPARSGAVPGSADCTVYRLLADASGVLTLTDAGLPARTVYNLAAAALPGSDYVEIRRDKFGTWFAAAAAPAPACAGFFALESDLRCEAGGTGTGAHAHLNLYRRVVTLAADPATGCLGRSEGAWAFVKRVACCDAHCASGEDPTCPPAVPLCATVSGSGNCDGAYTLDKHTTYNGYWTDLAVGNCRGFLNAQHLFTRCAAGYGWFLGGVGAPPEVKASSVVTSPHLTVTFTGVDFSVCGGGANATVVVTDQHCSAGTGTGGTGACPAVVERGLTSSSNAGSGGVVTLMVTVNAGERLVVSVGQQRVGGGAIGDPAAVTFNGVALARDTSTWYTGGPGDSVYAGVYSLAVAATTTAVITVTPYAGVGWAALSAAAVRGVSGAHSVITGAGHSVQTQQLAGAAYSACGYYQACFVTAPNNPTWAAVSTAQDGGQDQNLASAFKLMEGFALVGPAAGNARADLNGTSLDNWAGAGVVYQ